MSTDHSIACRIARSIRYAYRHPGKRSSQLIARRRSAKNVIWNFIGLLSITAIFTDELQKKVQLITWDILLSVGYAVLLIYAIRAALLILDAWAVFSNTTAQKRKKLALRAPISETTKTYVEKYSVAQIVAGTAIEVFTHPYLGPDLAYNGWEPDHVKIIDSHDVLRNKFPYSGNPFEEFGEDNPKFTLQSFTFPFTDAGDQLRLKVARTSWHDAKMCQKALTENDILRHSVLKPGDINNKLPSLLCLHVVALTAENDFIVFRRTPKSQFHAGKMSISFEEQFSQEDMMAGENKRAERWFQRAICEELFPLSGPINHEDYKNEVWSYASNYIEFARIWSCIVEEDCANVSLVGVCRLKVKTEDLLDVCDEMQLRFSSRREKEGDLCVMTFDEIETFVLTGKSKYRLLTHYNSLREDIANLHPTSVYRAFLVYSCLSFGKEVV